MDLSVIGGWNTALIPNLQQTFSILSLRPRVYGVIVFNRWRNVLTLLEYTCLLKYDVSDERLWLQYDSTQVTTPDDLTTTNFCMWCFKDEPVCVLVAMY